jgi:hypothetical protein
MTNILDFLLIRFLLSSLLCEYGCCPPGHLLSVSSAGFFLLSSLSLSLSLSLSSPGVMFPLLCAGELTVSPLRRGGRFPGSKHKHQGPLLSLSLHTRKHKHKVKHTHTLSPRRAPNHRTQSLAHSLPRIYTHTFSHPPTN